MSHAPDRSAQVTRMSRKKRRSKSFRTQRGDRVVSCGCRADLFSRVGSRVRHIAETDSSALRNACAWRTRRVVYGTHVATKTLGEQSLH